MEDIAAVRSSSSGTRSISTPKTSSPKPSTSTKSTTSTRSTPAKPATPKTGKSTAKPGSTIKTADGKTIKSSTAKPSSSKYKRSTGVVGDNGYSPRFTGYSPPAGSVVYYPQHSALDYLPWVYLFSMNSPSHDQATVVQPDNKQVVAEPQKGADGLVIFNWIFLVLIALAIIAGIVWIVNKKTTKEQ